MFNLFGPQQYLYEDAIKFGHGLGREAAWMLMHPLFEQANERNYHTEAMVRIVWFQKISIPPQKTLWFAPPPPPRTFRSRGSLMTPIPLSLSRIFEQGLRLPSLEIQSGFGTWKQRKWILTQWRKYARMFLHQCSVNFC